MQTGDDVISRQAAIDALEREKTYCSAFRDGYSKTNIFEKYNMGLTDGIKAIKNVPSAEAVEVVWCKDCRYWDKTQYSDYATLGECIIWHVARTRKDYCSEGRTDE